MTAAKITPTFVGKELISQSKEDSSTTNRRMARLHIEGTKATASDWFLLSDYITAANVRDLRARTKNSNNVWMDETITYDSDDAKLILTHASTGTSYAVVEYFE